MSDLLELYWQPGCTSCLRAREFLASREIPFNSINVRTDSEAMEKLSALGARSVPVLVRGNEWVFAQDLDQVAAFVGGNVTHQRLPSAELVKRLQAFLALGRQYALDYPRDRMGDAWPGRARTVTDLVFHIQMVVVAFLDAARGDELTEAHFERKPAPGEDTIDGLLRVADHVSNELAEWWRQAGPAEPAGTFKTYYGEFDVGPVLERTTWHAGQHVRQLCELLIATKTSGVQRPDPALLAGLPFPQSVWDRG